EPYLAKLPSGAFADMMRDELVRRAGHGGRIQPEPPVPPQAPGAGSGSNDRPLTPVQYAVALIVHRPSLAAEVEKEALAGPATPRGVEFLRELIDFCRHKPQFSTAMLLEAWRDRREAPWMARLAARDVRGVIADPDEMSMALAQTLARIRRQMIQTRIRELQQAQLNEGGLDEDQTS